jgi:hypothetical protein
VGIGQVAWDISPDDNNYWVKLYFCTKAVLDNFGGRCGCLGDLGSLEEVFIGRQASTLMMMMTISLLGQLGL